MLIGIDGNEANVQDRVGVNVYAFDLLRHIYYAQKKLRKNTNPITNSQFGLHEFVVYLKKAPLPDMPPECDFWKYEVLPGGPLWILTRLIPYLYFGKDRPDVLFSPSHYVPLVAPMPRVCSIMDLGYLEFMGQFNRGVFWQLKYWTASSITVSKSVIAISNATKKDIVRHYPKAKEKVHVTHLGYDKTRFNANISRNEVKRVVLKYIGGGKGSNNASDSYILFLSTLKPSKNIEGLIEAFLQIKNRRSGIKLVIAGRKGWLFESVFEKVKDLGLQNDVVFTGFIEEKDKPALMAGAKVFAAPSFWEGFGLHVLESMAVGTPVVASNVGSLPEVVGDAGILVDPNSIVSIAKGLDKVLLSSRREYNALVEKGLVQSRKFDWDKTAGATLKVLESVK